MVTYLLLGYLFIGFIVALIVAGYDYQRGQLRLLAAFLGGLAWPLLIITVTLLSQTKLKALYAREKRKLQEKKRQQHYRQEQRKHKRP